MNLTVLSYLMNMIMAFQLLLELRLSSLYQESDDYLYCRYGKLEMSCMKSFIMFLLQY